MERVERERGIELVALAVHSRFVGMVVQQMWEFTPHTAVLSKTLPEPIAVT